ncbi:unnamed protein product, partial [Ilex paraguariensis]
CLIKSNIPNLQDLPRLASPTRNSVNGDPSHPQQNKDAQQDPNNPHQPQRVWEQEKVADNSLGWGD